MFAHSKTKNVTKESVVLDFAKGLIIAIVISFALIILTALILKFVDVSDMWLVPITLVIKGISVLVGSIFAVKGDRRGLVKGAIFGLIYVTLAFLIFGLIAGKLAFDLSLLLDYLFCLTLGALVGIVKVNRA